MRIYGAGSIEDVKRCTAMGAVGILTNPQGFEQYYKGKMTLEQITQSLLDATDLPVYIQIHGETSVQLVERGRKLHALSPRVGYKIVANENGFSAIKELQAEGIRCIATGLFSVPQAAIAAAVGAFGICPFVCRGQDVGIDMLAVLREIKSGYSQFRQPPEIIAVSLRSVTDVDQALRVGVDAVGMRWLLMREMMSHPLSDRTELLFAKNWANVKGEDVGYLQHAMQLEEVVE